MSSNFTPEQLREAASRGAAPSPFLLEESPLTKPDPGNSSSKPSSSSFPEFSSSSASLDPFNMDVVDSSSFLGTVANCTNHFSSGSPGHTPFPHRREPEPNSKSILSPLPGFASSSPIIIKSEGVGSPAPFLDLQGPSPPVNTPEESANSLEEAVIKEAQRKEKELKQRRSQEQLLQKFDVLRGSTPERSGIAMPKKRLRDAFDEESTRVNPELMARLEALSRERRVFEDREKSENLRQRRLGSEAALEIFRNLVPGLDSLTEKSDVYEATAKYILFIKQNIGTQFDQDFVREHDD